MPQETFSFKKEFMGKCERMNLIDKEPKVLFYNWTKQQFWLLTNK